MRISVGPQSIRTRLLLLVLAIVLPMTAIAAWYLSVDAEQAREAAYSEVRVLADDTAARLAAILHDNEAVLARLAARPRIRALEAKRCDPILAEYVSLHPEFSTLALRDARANLLCTLVSNPPTAEEVLQNRWFQEVISHGRFAVSDASKSRRLARWVWVSAYPVRDARVAVSGVVFFSNDLLKLNRELFKAVPKNALVGVVDGQRNIMLRSVDPEQWIGKPSAGASRAANEAPTNAREGFFAAPDVNGIRRLYAFTRVPGVNWRVYAGLPEDEVLAKSRETIARSIGLGFGILVLLLALAWWLAEAIARPIRGLARITQDIAQGGTARAQIAGPAEVVEVAHRLNELLDARAQAQQVIGDNEERLRLALDSVGDGCWDWNTQTNQVIYSKRWKEMLGYAESEVANDLSEWSSRIHSEDMPRVMADLQDHLQDRTRAYSSEYRMRCKDGSWKWILDRGTVVRRTPEGKALRIIGTQSDITERKRSETIARTRLRLSELRTAPLEEVLLEAVNTAEALSASRVGFFHVVDDDQESLRLQVWSSNTSKDLCRAEGAGAHNPISSAGVWADCFRAQEPIIHNDFQTLSHRKGMPEGHAALTRELLVPIIRGGKVTGILGVGNKAADYTLTDLETVQLIASLVQDTIDRRHMEEALRERETRYSALVDATIDGFWILDGTGRILEVNDRYLVRSGYRREELVGKRVFEIDAAQSSREIDASLAKSGHDGIRVFETVHRAKDGSAWPVEISTIHRLEHGGRYHSFLRDISERHAAREQLERLLHEQAAVLNSEVVGIVKTKGRVMIWCNATFERMLGYEKDELTGESTRKVYQDEAAHIAFREAAYPVIVSGGVFRTEIQYVRKDGSLGWFDISGARLHPHGGESIWSFIDISERKRLEEARLSSQKLESLGTLAGGIAHDFNNILAAIIGNAYLAAKDVGVGHAALGSLCEIEKAGARGKELVRRIMAFGRPQKPRRETADLTAVVEEVLKLLRPTLPAGLALVTHFSRGVPQIMADAAQVHEVLVNLTTNAAHAIGPQVGEIDYVLEESELGADEAARLNLSPGRYVRLTVKDSGCGMDEATQSRIFDVFYTTKSVGEGSGLGLSVVYGIMHSHRGTITVESAPAKGSSFHLYFPATSEPSKPETKRPAAGAVLSAGKRIMYVDDEEALVFLGKRVLQQLGHEFWGFTSPQSALEAFRAHPEDYDVAITDLAMPQMSGVDLTRQLLAIRKDLPILMTSGHISAQAEASAREAGVRGFLLKPASIEELSELIDGLFLSRTAPAADEATPQPY